MLDAVFISDLHLHPAEAEINARFNAFIDWAAAHTKAVYILGDFFHAWPGDDGLDAWSKTIAQRLAWLAQQKVLIYYLHGNRDFLLGKKFADLAGMTILSEPAILTFDSDIRPLSKHAAVELQKKSIMLAHGDRYCTLDKAHQRFRRLTRNRWFAKIFLCLPFSLRNKIVNKVRQHSQTNRTKTAIEMDVVVESMLQHMLKQHINILVHGHTHKPGLINYQYNNSIYQQYVLSDWDESPSLLCYDNTNGFNFIRPV
ncbi:UDP-2,3-diacylglucosamine diphosphatase [Legionella brunensis]|uniref:UDP-2,3-diacylglucosamine hydrolase n=1 Tax=Legionella brunensis TaxID=29422 RepID=A0A0W0STJ3_9GAMM|nr:UDP-2,3-diacylglucosamine diphosphatase [Legionella brunensis]KTC86715.1 UDP-2,3-diacylglucosamine hydrolase [Legionella brunensis]